jgi:fucose 4-O-acetylase-like acetyltransferase
MTRDENLDTVRGIACILLVFYHVVGAGPNSGLRLAPDSGYTVFNETLAYVRMPLFTFLSGVVYAMRPVQRGNARRFTIGKLKRIAIPFVCLSLLFAVVQKLAPGTNGEKEWAEIPLTVIWPYTHLWFISALLVIFAIVGVVDYFGLLREPTDIAAVTMIAALLFIFRHGEPGIFAVNRALYLLPFFLIGVAMKRFGWRWAITCALLGLVSLEIDITIGALCGIALLAWMPVVPALAKIGYFSYSIYLFHVFGTAASRISLGNVVGHPPTLLLIGTVWGIAIPIAIHMLVVRVPYLSWALLGARATGQAGTPLPPQPDGALASRSA